MQPKYDETREAATRTQNEREEVKHKIENLYAKQGRGRQFTSQEDRDAFLRSQSMNSMRSRLKRKILLLACATHSLIFAALC